MRAIDADKLLKRVEQSWQNAGLHGEDYYKFKKWVHSMPTIEAEPVKHGRWKHHQYGNTAGYYECDNCGKINSYESNYCPKCGAKMDK